MRRLARRALLLLLLLGPGGAMAQAPDTVAAAPVGAIPADGGLPVQPAPPRTLRAQWHVYAAFAVAWLLLFGYALSLGRRFRKLEEEVGRMDPTHPR